MTEEEQKNKIDEIYESALQKLERLGKKRKDIIHDYIKELENKKIDEVRASLGMTNH